MKRLKIATGILVIILMMVQNRDIYAERGHKQFAIEVAKFALRSEIYKGEIPKSIDFTCSQFHDLYFVESKWTSDPLEKQYVIIVHAPSMTCLGIFPEGFNRPEKLKHLDEMSKKFSDARKKFTKDIYSQLISK